MRSLIALVGLLIILETFPAEACYLGPAAPGDLVRGADVIVRARAVDAVTVAATSQLNGPVTTVRFVILEQLKGNERLFDLAVRGSMVSYLDFNDHPVPYGGVRSEGRNGSCFAKTYERGGEYLLILRRTQGELTPYWMAQSATNEQIHGADDPWVDWVRNELAQRPPALPPTRFRVER